MLSWILRIGVAGCFIGHGAFGILTKAAWLPYFAFAGVAEPVAWRLMPLVGAMDVAIGLLALVWPCRALYAWAAVWAIWTALLRPLVGEPFWEFVERAGNYGVPIAFLVAVGLPGALLRRLPARWPPLDATTRGRLLWTLRITTSMVLAGHAGLGLSTQKVGLAQHYAALGLDNPSALVPLVGAFEFILAALVLLRPVPTLCIGVCVWKVATESLFIVAGASHWELVERMGSYAAPLALAVLLQRQRQGGTRIVLPGGTACTDPSLPLAPLRSEWTDRKPQP